MTNKVFNFPKKPTKEELDLLIPESDFSILIKNITSKCYRHGCISGFSIGFAVANILMVAMQHFFK